MICERDSPQSIGPESVKYGRLAVLKEFLLNAWVETMDNIQNKWGWVEVMGLGGFRRSLMWKMRGMNFWLGTNNMQHCQPALKVPKSSKNRWKLILHRKPSRVRILRCHWLSGLVLHNFFTGNCWKLWQIHQNNFAFLSFFAISAQYNLFPVKTPLKTPSNCDITRYHPHFSIKCMFTFRENISYFIFQLRVSSLVSRSAERYLLRPRVKLTNYTNYSLWLSYH